jgi:hypothetical protein
MNTLVLIEESVEHKDIIINSIRDNSKAIVVTPETTIYDIIDEISLNTIESIGLCYHYRGVGSPFFKKTLARSNHFFSNDLLELFRSWNEENNNVKHVDLLTCNPLILDIHNTEIEMVSTEYNIDVHYSLNDTGTVPNGDWIMESSNRDTKQIYFTENIKNYTYRLGFQHLIIGPNPDSNNRHADSSFYDLSTNPYIDKMGVYHPHQIITQDDIDKSNTYTGTLLVNARFIDFSGNIDFNQLSIVINPNNYSKDITEDDTTSYPHKTIKLYSADNTNHPITITSNIHTFVNVYDITDSTKYAKDITIEFENLNITYTNPDLRDFGGIVNQYSDSNSQFTGRIKLINNKVTIHDTTYTTISDVYIAGLIGANSFNKATSFINSNEVTIGNLDFTTTQNICNISGLVGTNCFTDVGQIQNNTYECEFIENNVTFGTITTKHNITEINGLLSKSFNNSNARISFRENNTITFNNITTEGSGLYLSSSYHLDNVGSKTVTFNRHTINFTNCTIDCPNCDVIINNNNFLYNGTLNPQSINYFSTNTFPKIKLHLKIIPDPVIMTRNSIKYINFQGYVYYAGLRDKITIDNTTININIDDISFNNTTIQSITHDNNNIYSTITITPKPDEYNEDLDTTLSYMEDPTKKTEVSADSSITTSNFTRYTLG